jgi:DNA-binding response OmpR family regulator
MRAKLLYVEDDVALSFVTRDNLERQGFAVVCRHNGQEALDALAAERFDLCILDVMLPEVDGFAIARAIRARDQETPIIFLTAKSMKEDKLFGLKIGADDYLTKPFSIEELILKIEVFLRRSKVYAPAGPAPLAAIGAYRFDAQNLILAGGGRSRQLTQREADLLCFLAERPNQLVKRAEILEVIWGQDDYFLGRSLDVFISRLRKYLADDPKLRIENVHGVGFRLVVDD